MKIHPQDLAGIDLGRGCFDVRIFDDLGKLVIQLLLLPSGIEISQVAPIFF